MHMRSLVPRPSQFFNAAPVFQHTVLKSYIGGLGTSPACMGKYYSASTLSRLFEYYQLICMLLLSKLGVFELVCACKNCSGL